MIADFFLTYEIFKQNLKTLILKYENEVRKLA
jgi:hypothetical protein